MSIIKDLLGVSDELQGAINMASFQQKVVMRKHDMSPEGKMTAMVQDDGDACLSIFDDEGEAVASVEFTTPFAGGGQSPNTYYALRILFFAMILDEVENGGHRSGGYPLETDIEQMIKSLKMEGKV